MPIGDGSIPTQSNASQRLHWSFTAGGAATAIALLMLATAMLPEAMSIGGSPILALALMSVGMIAAAIDGRVWVGLVLAVLSAASLILIATVQGIASATHFASAMLAIIIASFSFAARGALFARSAADKGWLVALFVVAGEAAIVITASIEPDLWPDWLLVLLPAQWANIAIQAALGGAGTVAGVSAGIIAAFAPLLALLGTALATLLVARLWPKRWPYLIMFSTWLSLSALVWYWPV